MCALCGVRASACRAAARGERGRARAARLVVVPVAELRDGGAAAPRRVLRLAEQGAEGAGGAGDPGATHGRQPPAHTPPWRYHTALLHHPDRTEAPPPTKTTPRNHRGSMRLRDVAVRVVREAHSSARTAPEAQTARTMLLVVVHAEERVAQRAAVDPVVPRARIVR